MIFARYSPQPATTAHRLAGKPIEARIGCRYHRLTKDQAVKLRDDLTEAIRLCRGTVPENDPLANALENPGVETTQHEDQEAGEEEGREISNHHGEKRSTTEEGVPRRDTG